MASAEMARQACVAGSAEWRIRVLTRECVCVAACEVFFEEMTRDR